MGGPAFSVISFTWRGGYFKSIPLQSKSSTNYALAYGDYQFAIVSSEAQALEIRDWLINTTPSHFRYVQ